MENRPKRWVPDSEVTRCFLCSTSFDVTTRKHHCRCCGRIACASCTPSKALIPLNEVVYPPSSSSFSLGDFDPREAQRVCRECELMLAPMQADLQQTMTHAAMPTHHDRASIERYLNSPVTFDMTGEIVKAANTLLNFTSDNAIEGADSIPRDLIAEAKGLAFITFVKVGLFVTARVGTGLVVSRRRDGGWSAPSALGSAGLGWGFQIGGELTDVVIVLNTMSAVEAFTSRGQVSLGTELSLSVGPVGRTASTDIRAGDGGVTAAFSYAHSKGVFIGVSVEAATVVTRKEANRDFYGVHVTARELLLGDFPPPKAAEPLYNALEEVASYTRRAGSRRGFQHVPRPPPPAPDGNGDSGQHFAPFRPEAEDHLRSFAVTPEEKAQMEEDYRLAVAMQKGEVSPDAESRDAAPAQAQAAKYPGSSSGVMTRIGSIFGGGENEKTWDTGNGHTNGGGSKARRGGSFSGKGRGFGKGGVEEDDWERERRARIEQARKAEGGGFTAADNELGEMGSFLNTGTGGDEGRREESVSDAAFGGGKAVTSGLREDEEEDESSDDDEYRRDIAQFAARKRNP